LERGNGQGGTVRDTSFVTAKRWRAVNLASESANSIHDDATARSLGFQGGFVGGVTLLGQVFDTWLADGRGVEALPVHLDFKLTAPTYEGETVAIQFQREADQSIFAIESEAGQVTSMGEIVTFSSPCEFEGDDLIQIERIASIARGSLDTVRSFSQEEVDRYRSRTGGSEPKDTSIVPIGMWTNPMLPIIAILAPDYLTMHRTSSIDIFALPVADTAYSCTTAIRSALLNEDTGKGVIVVTSTISPAAGGNPLAVIIHKSAVRKRANG
jgi:hypothetical protein